LDGSAQLQEFYEFNLVNVYIPFDISRDCPAFLGKPALLFQSASPFPNAQTLMARWSGAQATRFENCFPSHAEARRWMTASKQPGLRRETILSAIRQMTGPNEAGNLF